MRFSHDDILDRAWFSPDSQPFIFLLTQRMPTWKHTTDGPRHFRAGDRNFRWALSLWQTAARNWIRFMKFQTKRGETLVWSPLRSLSPPRWSPLLIGDGADSRSPGPRVINLIQLQSGAEPGHRFYYHSAGIRSLSFAVRRFFSLHENKK